MKATHNPPTLAPVELTPADVLRGAAGYLQRYDWIQGDYFAAPDPHQPAVFQPACAAGAICAAALGTATNADDIPTGPDGYLAHRALRLFAGYLNNTDVVESGVAEQIGDWNDEQGRTVVDVILTLTDAANDWDRRHPQGGDLA
jgi:hypothetical protein